LPAAELLAAIERTGGSGGLDPKKLERAREFIARGETIALPEIGADESGKLSFTNGRHRTAALIEQGAKDLPVVMEGARAESVRDRPEAEKQKLRKAKPPTKKKREAVADNLAAHITAAVEAHEGVIAGEFSTTLGNARSSVNALRAGKQTNRLLWEIDREAAAGAIDRLRRRGN